MKDVWLISDTHFTHRNIIGFTREDGTPLRPFKSVEEMDEALVENWNSVVKPNDVVYHLGDVVINRSALPILGRLNGRKKLIRGNHDIFKTREYLPYFEEIYGSYKLSNYILTHIPIHPESIARWANGNIHGHLHANVVMKEVHYRGEYSDYDTILKVDDSRYTCVSVEQINYTPIHLDDIINTTRV